MTCLQILAKLSRTHEFTFQAIRSREVCDLGLSLLLLSNVVDADTRMTNLYGMVVRTEDVDFVFQLVYLPTSYMTQYLH